MEQHPVPQSISSYQFKLVGDMTLKQFLQLAGGVVVSLLFYASPLHPVIKWPFIVFFALLGAALAFLPFEERPLEQWIIAFIRSIYSPTIFTWNKTQVAPLFFQSEEGAVTPPLPPQKETKIQRLPFVSVLEDAEAAFLSKVTQLFGQPTHTPPTVPTPPTQTTPRTSSVSSLTTAPLVYQAPKAPQTPKAEEKSFAVPQSSPLDIGPRRGIIVEEKPAAPTAKTPTLQMTGVAEVVTGQASSTAQAAQFSLEAAPPNPPTQPNTIVGQVMDLQGHIVEGAILEIKDSGGRPVRALKSNKAGHFMIVTPLTNGQYEIVTEKEGLLFDNFAFQASGSFIPPIAIRGKAQGN